MPKRGAKKNDDSEMSKETADQMTKQFIESVHAGMSSSDVNKASSYHDLVPEKTPPVEPQPMFKMRPGTSEDFENMSEAVQRRGLDQERAARAEARRQRHAEFHPGKRMAAQEMANPRRQRQKGTQFWEWIKDASSKDADVEAKKKVMRKLWLYEKRHPESADYIRKQKPTMKWSLERLETLYMELNEPEYFKNVTDGGYSLIVAGTQFLESNHQTINKKLQLEKGKLKLAGATKNVEQNKEEFKQCIEDYVYDNFSYMEQPPAQRLVVLWGKTIAQTQIKNSM